MPTAFDIGITLEPPAVILEAEFEMFSLSIRSFREPLKRAIQQVMSPSIRQNFDVGGRPPWPELAPATLASKSGEGILVKTGLLQRVAGQLNVWELTSEEAYVSQLPRAEYGVIHQDGGGFIPARPFMVIQPEDEEAIEGVFADWLDERIARVPGISFSAGDFFGSE